MDTIFAHAAYGFVLVAARIEGNYELAERLIREHVVFLPETRSEAALTNEVANERGRWFHPGV